ncbi:TPA: hypothetical protein ACX6MG_001333 [Photobacterium damselae]|uniref:hypothetical protein n=1 Tax=Photobacterium damselae TaxID=38293 RepID=UPI001EFEA8FD|nr:hypothetical protein [Photobacterium damselae]MCG9707134.1 hypothetical protein [Photobacterium damselae]
MLKNKKTVLIAPIQKIVDWIEFYIGGFILWVLEKIIRFVFFSLFLSICFGVYFSSLSIGALALLSPIFIFLVLFVFWISFRLFLLSFFAISLEKKANHTLGISMITIPCFWVLASMNALFLLRVPIEISSVILMLIVVWYIGAFFIKGDSIFNFTHNHPIVIIFAIHALQVILFLEIFYPYTVETINISSIENCTYKEFTHRSNTRRFNECLITFKYDDKKYHIYIANPKKEVTIRKGLLFDHVI